jgi:hypothetical protein
MKTTDLISTLSKSVKPVKPLPNSFVRMLILLFAMILGSGLVFLLFSHRPDLNEVVYDLHFQLGILVLFISWLITTYSLSLLQLPTVNRMRYLIFGLTLIAGLSFIYGYWVESQKYLTEGVAPSGLKCSADILLLSILPLISLFLILRKSATVETLYSGLNIGICCAAFGALLLAFACPSNNSAHLLAWHLFLPFLILAGGGSLLSRKILKW